MNKPQKHRGVLRIEGTPIERHGSFYVSDEIDKLLAEIVEDIQMACGCTDGDDIRNHLDDYLTEKS